jgi:hypothetical protein
MGNLLNDLDSKILDRDSCELVIKSGRFPPPENDQDAGYIDMKKHCYNLMNMEGEMNGTRELWQAATYPDKMFALILEVCHKI